MQISDLISCAVDKLKNFPNLYDPESRHKQCVYCKTISEPHQDFRCSPPFTRFDSRNYSCCVSCTQKTDDCFYELRQLEKTIVERLKELYGESFRVKRSNGDIETDWEIIRVILVSYDGHYLAIDKKKSFLSKEVLLSDFFSLNDITCKP